MTAQTPMTGSGQAAGGAVAGAMPAVRLRPAAPAEGETVLWQGAPESGVWRLLELLGFLLLLGLLSLLAVALVAPHLGGSAFAGAPDAGALPLILLMVLGMIGIIALPVWLRASARGRARYMLTNRRALVWLGGRVVGEAVLFGAEMEVLPNSVIFAGRGVWLDWRLRDEGPDRIRFERIRDAGDCAHIAERHGARRR